MKRTLLQIVQNILSDMDSEDVNSISDSVEATQVASVVRDVYFNMVSTRMIPEHKQLTKLTSLSSSARPTHFKIPDSVKIIDSLHYNISTTGGVSFRELKYLEPLLFLTLNSEGDSSVVVYDVKGNTPIIIRNDGMPTYFTSFDDEHIIMDSFDSSYSQTLTEVNTQAYCQKIPDFTVSDDYTPDVDDVLFPYLIAESKSTCFSLFKSGVDQKIEQAARRQKSYVQNDIYRIHQENKRPKYGRG
tara:strand:+ start:3339 stop:4070 length:732 start_codon:yes stop_codon:yes gene_type:complete